MDEEQHEPGWMSAYALHADLGGGYCEECSRTEHNSGGVPIFVKAKWPCRTVRALEGRL